MRFLLKTVRQVGQVRTSDIPAVSGRHALRMSSTNGREFSASCCQSAASEGSSSGGGGRDDDYSSSGGSSGPTKHRQRHVLAIAR